MSHINLILHFLLLFYHIVNRFHYHLNFLLLLPYWHCSLIKSYCLKGNYLGFHLCKDHLVSFINAIFFIAWFLKYFIFILVNYSSLIFVCLLIFEYFKILLQLKIINLLQYFEDLYSNYLYFYFSSYYFLNELRNSVINFDLSAMIRFIY
jgi:hypothetical protein